MSTYPTLALLCLQHRGLESEDGRCVDWGRRLYLVGSQTSPHHALGFTQEVSHGLVGSSICGAAKLACMRPVHFCVAVHQIMWRAKPSPEFWRDHLSVGAGCSDKPNMPEISDLFGTVRPSMGRCCLLGREAPSSVSTWSLLGSTHGNWR
jgi:hypothetical protein